MSFSFSAVCKHAKPQHDDFVVALAAMDNDGKHKHHLLSVVPCRSCTTSLAISCCPSRREFVIDHQVGKCTSSCCAREPCKCYFPCNRANVPVLWHARYLLLREQASSFVFRSKQGQETCQGDVLRSQSLVVGCTLRRILVALCLAESAFLHC